MPAKNKWLLYVSANLALSTSDDPFNFVHVVSTNFIGKLIPSVSINVLLPVKE